VAVTTAGLHGLRLRPVPVAALEQKLGSRGAHEERRGKNREPTPRHQFQPWRLWLV
jgi:hypothetical protein